MKLFIILATQLLTLFSCGGQSFIKVETHQKIAQIDSFQLQNEDSTGIVYFSMNNGVTWKNASAGIPQKVRIGLGGVTSSDKLLAIATKEYGVFIYDFKDSIWNNIPTEKNIIDGNIGAIIHYKHVFYIGTQSKGMFISNDNGKNWAAQNFGLGNLTIRRFLELGNQLYVCTNDGFYVLNETTSLWERVYGENGLQVNGATVFQNTIYIATNKGIYKNEMEKS